MRYLLAFALIHAAAAQTAPSADARLERLEAAKWHPSSLGGAKELEALFAADFTSVEYGANPMGGVSRRAGRAVDPKLLAMLDSMHFAITDMKALHPSGTVTILSYRIAAPSIGWSAYASSTWAKRNGRWQTVFYQASRVAP